jgi:membrane-bound lytic murein transglycosylase D
VNQWVDERRDPEKSTVAAAKYLKQLYDRYNDWYLAAAGYNAGEGKIDRAIKKYATEDFWELSEGKYLRNETKDYVPKLIAAAVIARNPEKYGFHRVEYEKPVGFEDVELKRAVDLRIAAKCAGTDYDTLKTLNPELLHWVTPPSQDRYSLKIPLGTKEKFLSSLAALPDKKLMGDEIEKVEEPTSVRKLARERGLPAELVAIANGLSADDEIKSGTSVVLPLSPPEGEEFYEKNYERRRGGRMIAYRVKKGDSVQVISRKLGISVAALKDYNPQVNWSRVHTGQKLKLQASPAQSRYAKHSRHSKTHKGELAMRSRGETKKAKSSKVSGKVSKKAKKGASKKSASSAL